MAKLSSSQRILFIIAVSQSPEGSEGEAKQSHYSLQIAEPVPSISEESHSWFASALTCLAMTKESTPRNDIWGRIG